LSTSTYTDVRMQDIRKHGVIYLAAILEVEETGGCAEANTGLEPIAIL